MVSAAVSGAKIMPKRWQVFQNGVVLLGEDQDALVGVAAREC